MPEKIRPQSRSGQARVEYRAVQKEVSEKLAAGYSKIVIFEELTAGGKLTVSYSAFCDYIRGEGKRIHSRRKSFGSISRNGERNPLRPAAKPEPFFIDRSRTIDELTWNGPKEVVAHK